MSIPLLQLLDASFVWTEAAPSCPGADAPLARLGEQLAYSAFFDQLQADLVNPDKGVATAASVADWPALAPLADAAPLAAAAAAVRWLPPWAMSKHAHRHNFWYYYLHHVSQLAVSGELAWQHLVPLRLPLPIRIQKSPSGATAGPTIHLFADGYVYPHAVAVELKLRFDYGASPRLAGIVLGDLRRLYREAAPTVSIAGAEPQTMRLETLAQRLSAFLRRLVWGETAAGANFVLADQPISVVTAIKGIAPDPFTPLAAGDDLHRILDGFCSFRGDWPELETADLAPLSCANLVIGSPADGHIGHKTAGHVVYHHKRSRVVWMPSYLGNTTPHFSRLSCYHRNLTLSLLQTEVLAQAMFLFAATAKPDATLRSLAGYGAAPSASCMPAPRVRPISRPARVLTWTRMTA